MLETDNKKRSNAYGSYLNAIFTLHIAIEASYLSEPNLATIFGCNFEGAIIDIAKGLLLNASPGDHAGAQ